MSVSLVKPIIELEINDLWTGATLAVEEAIGKKAARNRADAIIDGMSGGDQDLEVACYAPGQCSPFYFVRPADYA